MPRSGILEDSYNNAVSGLTSTTTKAATDELAADHVIVNSTGTQPIAFGTDAISIKESSSVSDIGSVAYVC